MQITALFQVINYLKDKSGDPSLLEGYKKLSELTREASKSTEGDLFAAIMKENEKLKKMLMDSEPGDWGYSAYSLYEKINVNQLFGKAATEYLGDLITTETKDFLPVYNDLTKRMKLMAKFSDNVNKFIQLFDLVIPSEVFRDTIDTDKSSLILYFEGHLNVQNIADLERYARLWDGILGAFSRLTGEENLTLDISSFHNGNVVLGVAANDNILKPIMTGVTKMISILPAVLKIRKVQVDITPLPLNYDFNVMLEEEIQSLVDRTSIETAQSLTFEFFNDTKEPDEIIAIMSRSLKQTLSFIEKGGKVEFRPRSKGPETADLNRTLIDSFAIVRELEVITEKLPEELVKRGWQAVKNDPDEAYARM